MIERRRARLPLLALVLVAAACEVSVEAGDADIALRPGGSGGGGVLYDGTRIGGWSASEFVLHHYHRGIRLRRVCLGKKFNERCLQTIGSVAGVLVGSDAQGTYSGLALVDSRWDLDFDAQGDGVADSTASLKLAGRSVVAVPGGTLELIDLQIDRTSVTGALQGSLPPGTGPLPLCTPDPARGGATAAAVLGDVSFDPADASFSAHAGALHIACTSAAIGRATTLGYRPEAQGLDGFEAMVRALVGDYCGTGDPPVAPGGAVALADVWGIQTASAPLVEARWSSGGALCLDHVRDPNIDAAEVRDLCGIPTCSAGGLGSAGELALSSLTP